MEVFAGFGEYTDHEIGRLVQAIEDLGQLDNTLIFYEVGDNGASAEGTMNGLFNEMTYFNGAAPRRRDHASSIDELGGPKSYPTTPPAGRRGWTRRSPGRSRSPALRRHPQPLVVHWPNGIKAKGEVRIAVAPRHRHRADHPRSGRLARAEVVNGVAQTPIEGVSMVYTFEDAKAKDRHTTQYFEIFGNRGIYHDGWLAHPPLRRRG